MGDFGDEIVLGVYDPPFMTDDDELHSSGEDEWTP